MAFTAFPTVGPYSPAQLTTDLNTNFNDAQSQLNALDGRLDVVEPLVTSQGTAITTAQGDIVALDGRLDTAESNITTLTTNLGTTNTNVSNLTTSVNNLGLPQILNRVINGCFRVDQRNSGASQTITAGAALAYTADRWYAYCTGANITGQRVTVSGAYRYRFTGAASNTGLGFAQRIESLNSYDLAGQTATLQVKASSSSLTSLGWAVYYATTSDTFGTVAAPTRTLIASGTFTITSTEARYSANISIPSGATTGLEIVFTGGALLASQTLTFGDVQLERGSVATTFFCRPITTEFIMCQRYYALNPAWAGTSGGGTPTAVAVGGNYPVRMFAIPTPVLIVSTSGVVDPYVAGRNITSVGSLVGTVDGARIVASLSTSTSVNKGHFLEAGAVALVAEIP